MGENQVYAPALVSVVLPSLNPTGKLLDVVTGIIGEGFEDIIIVDDGSDEEHLEPFREVEALSQCHVLRHEKNRGKGAALKTAFKYFIENRANFLGVVTVDGDGQHMPADVRGCADSMVANGNSIIIGARDFSGSGVPRKSYLGNTITSFVFKTLCGIRLSDTQTGLRAIPAAHLPVLTLVKGDRFEYETNMLLEMSRAGISFTELSIRTVYEGKNEGSHFRPFVDSVKIYAIILRYSLSSIASFVIDLMAFWLALKIFGPALGVWQVPVCTIIARAASSFFNFNANRRLVFDSRASYGETLLRYYMLCIPQTLVSAGLVWALSSISSAGVTVTAVTFIKMLVDVGLFFISFYVQREWVFKKDKKTG